MADLNRFCFTGRLTADASYRTLASGKGVLTANVAVNTGYGEYKKTLFIKVQMWGERGNKIVGFLKKGNLIASDGELSRSEWRTKETDELRVDFVVDVMNIQMLCSKQQSTNDSDSDAGGAAESDELVF